MELKYEKPYLLPSARWRSNRTFMELKYGYDNLYPQNLAF